MNSEVNAGKGKKPVLKGLTLKELKEYFTTIGEKRYRHLIDSYDEMENVPKVLRQQLNETTGEINRLKLISTASSPQTGTTKYLLETLDGHKIESVVIPDEKRTTLCVSTQAGCPLDCKFCATGLMGYKKNLTVGEIFDQFKIASKEYKADSIKNIVFMGMGEPLLNFDATLKALEIFGEELTTQLRMRRVTVSTAGIAPKIMELADSGLRAKLAFSLHSCFEDIRSKLMPINDKYPLRDNLHSIRYFTKKTHSRVTFEYIMISGINDREEDFKELVKLCKSLPCKINVIPFNSLEHMKPKGFSAELQPSPYERTEAFVQALRDQNITVTVRYTQGEDIAAACGQLAIEEENKTYSSVR